MIPLSERLRQLRFTLPGLFYRSSAAPIIRGNMKKVIIMKPKGEIFQEAIFVLRDDFFQRSGVSRQELLMQAKAAADGCIGDGTSAGSRNILPSAFAAFILGAASAILVLWLFGLL